MIVYNPNKDIGIDEKLIGGKAKNLAFMTKLPGINIPKWFVITSVAFEDALANKLDIGQELRNEIDNILNQLNMNNKFLAVRSSAVGEDSAEFSFAGQLESFLYIKYNDLFEAIENVWKSTCSDRVLFYAKENRLKTSSINVAVIVQEMIDSEVSGVAFGMDPISGDRKAITISSVYGLGEGLVSGLLDSDNYRVVNGEIHSEIAKKLKYVCLDKKNGKNTKVEDVPIDKQNVSSLSNDWVKNIALQVNKICKYYGRPQDIEWAISNNNLYVLQSRPITTLNKIPDKTETKIIWDNSNIIESYSGVTTPLTFSFIGGVYTEVYKQFCKIMGVEEDIIEKNNIFQMVGLIKGRVYYNLLNWYNVLSLLPGYSINADFMEQMLGVKEKLEVLPTVVHSKKNKYLRVINLFYKSTVNLLQLPKQIKGFYRLLDKALLPYDSIHFDKENINDILNHYFSLEKRLLKKWSAPIVNDFFAMIFYGVLKKIIIKWGIDIDGTLQNDLLIGEGNIISTEPVRKIREMANKICKNENLKKLFLNNNDSHILKELFGYEELNSEINNYIKKFGNRCIGELKLETITYKEKPEMLINLIKSYVNQGYIDLEEENMKKQGLRKKAELRVHSALKNKIIKGIILNAVLKQTRLKISNRENLRFERTRLFGVVREMFLAIGRKFYYESIINSPRDIFYLTKEEIFGYITGTAVSINLKEIIETRKIEFQSYESENPEDRFETFGIVYHGNTFKKNSKKTCNDIESDLSGIGCCPGIVKARVKIVRNLDDAGDLNGCIMVAERTDPGWVPLFPISKGILVERGSILSHSAIVAREMGIPAIVGINNLLTKLQDDDIVEMDGTKGTIRLCKRN